MQLDLFEDNRPGILLNIADEYLRERDFEKALSVCEQIREEYPANLHASELYALIQTWHGMISGIEPSSCNPQQLEEMLSKLDSLAHPALRTAVLTLLAEALQAFPEPDQVFLPPRFHRGHLLLKLGKFVDATASFCNALTSPDLERGRFLAWSADAMTLAGKAEDAVSVYLQAFLEDPATVDVAFIKNRTIKDLNLNFSLQTEGSEEEDEVAWLPVRGWLLGVFTLPLQHPPVFEELESRVNCKTLPAARLWFDLLTLAEHLRTVQRDDRRMAATRRLMKRLNEEMFECYMQKIRGTRQ